MHESTTPATPYEVLGVSSAASMEELRRAYRRRLRETHPDTGGDAVAFHNVQVAWETIGTPYDRAMFDNAAPVAPAAVPEPDLGFTPSGDSRSPYGTTGASSTGNFSERPAPTWGTPAPAQQAEQPPMARSHGHPGGWNREEYFHLMREWVGRGAKVDNPYDPAMVRSAPREIRHLLADANAEEETARLLSRLDISYTIWHDVASDVPGPGSEQKIDHIVLGPAGLFAMLSEDWGGALQVRKGEIVSDMLLVGERPIASLARRTKSITRTARVRFSALVIVVPDGSTAEVMDVVGREKGVPTVVVQRSRVPELMMGALALSPRLSADEIFGLRERLQRAIRFI
ncbi:MAG: molecular chaperone DnaJ [Glaciihabitans sp.]|nr:molecular chaperone DnaJ [Glaciihabitans sp.]